MRNIDPLGVARSLAGFPTCGYGRIRLIFGCKANRKKRPAARHISTTRSLGMKMIQEEDIGERQRHERWSL